MLFCVHITLPFPHGYVNYIIKSFLPILFFFTFCQNPSFKIFFLLSFPHFTNQTSFNSQF
jgi:hypothetical protein